MFVRMILCFVFSGEFFLVISQLASSINPEQNLQLEIETCANGKGCRKVPCSITMDATWRTLKDKSGKKDCFDGKWDTTLCPDPVTCAQNCALGGINYTKERISTNGSSINIKMFKKDGDPGSRIYLLDGKESYRTFYLLNNEFTFDVDVTKAACGVATGIYFSSMDPNGGKSATNQAAAKYGTGYCDAQGPKNMKFVEGKANMLGQSGGLGNMGYACAELDVWEGNSVSQAFTPHNCQSLKAEVCEGEKCERMCDRPGCDFASYRMGNTSFYGPSKIIDTAQKFTVITQFITSDGTEHGELVEIRRLYQQNGRLIPNSRVNLPNVTPFDSITDRFCDTVQSVVNQRGTFKKNGGLKSMGESMRRGMVLIFTLWVDEVAGMDWLDGNHSDDVDKEKPGRIRGPCPPGAGKPFNVKKHNPETGVIFSSIRVGPIGSTFES